MRKNADFKFTEQYFIPDALSNLNSLSIESMQTTSTKQFCKSISSILTIPNHLYIFHMIFIDAIVLIRNYILVTCMKTHKNFSSVVNKIFKCYMCIYGLNTKV